MDTTQTVRQASPVEYPAAAKGYIGNTAVAYGEPVSVILPAASTERHYGPCDWLAGHGTTLPQEGDECVVVFDEQNHPTIVWWAGAYTLLTPPAWTVVSYEHSWKTLPEFESAAYLKDTLGFVHLRGRITGGVTASVAFTLPAGYRPNVTTIVTPAAAINVTTPVAALLAIGTTGLVEPYVTGTFTSVGINGISFLAEA